ncbi:PE/PPE C-terminal domain-containing protein [Mycobacterium intracellulare]|uniref:PE/PPE C-terminal domain-containing protein n=1 Tax=Mycobacterium intracellulare TaxID=1767 RepID=UPI001CDA1F6F|nr:PE/PPE C-terminal domain-containing protein [Mycobacterium intracellulare]MCA2251376.1 PE/PPE C-terminal domain-containing protein [Mycobacterium intracellulare]
MSQLMSAIPHQLQLLTTPGFIKAASAPTTAAAITAAGTSPSLITAVADFNTLLRPIFYASQILKTPFYALSFQLAASRAVTQGSTLPELTLPTAGAVGAVEAPAPHPILASMGRAAPLGGLSVPQNWTTADAAPDHIAETVAPPQQSARALPAWAHPPQASASAPFSGHITKSAARRKTNATFRMRDRRYRIPQPPPGG